MVEQLFRINASNGNAGKITAAAIERGGEIVSVLEGAHNNPNFVQVNVKGRNWEHFKDLGDFVFPANMAP